MYSVVRKIMMLALLPYQNLSGGLNLFFFGTFFNFESMGSKVYFESFMVSVKKHITSQKKVAKPDLSKKCIRSKEVGHLHLV